MNEFVDIINNDFQKTLKGQGDPPHHLFFDSFINWWKETSIQWENEPFDENIIKEYDSTETKYNYNPSVSLSDIKPVDDCKYIPRKTMSKKQLEKLHTMINNDKVKDFNVIRNHLDKMFDYNLPPTISNLDKYLHFIKNTYNSINIIIAGAGPIGLFTALYLTYYYRKFHIINVNVLLLDNRIYKESIKLPYSRLTQFGIDISEIQVFIKNIYCWKSITTEYNRHFDYINILENLLYLTAYNYNIPMYFTKKYETFDKIKQLAEDNNFHYIFDCTGGRLGAQLTPDIKWDLFSFKKDNLEIKLTYPNQYRFFVDDQEYSHTTVLLQLLDKNKKQFPVGNLFDFVTNSNDKKIINTFKNLCLKLDDFYKVIRHIKRKRLRYLFFMNIKYNGIELDKVKYVKIITFNSSSHHVNRAAQMIGKDLAYIGLGDTLGVSEYGIFYGLKTAMLFSKHVCHLLSSVEYL